MPSEHTMWIHGHNVQMEEPDPRFSIHRWGPFSRVDGLPHERESSSESVPFVSAWFQFAIPTPALVGDEFLRVSSVLLRFRPADGGTLLEDVHAFDGERKIAEFGPRLHRERGPFDIMEWRTEEFDIPAGRLIVTGIGISVRVAFRRHAETNGPCSFDFASAGMTYSYLQSEGSTLISQSSKG